MGLRCFRRGQSGLRLRLAISLRSSGLRTRGPARGGRRRSGLRGRTRARGRYVRGRRPPAAPPPHGARHGEPHGRRAQVHEMARPQPVGGHRLPEQPQQHNKGQRRGLPPAPLLHGRPQQAEDAQPRGHPAPGAAARLRVPRCVQERLRGIEELVLRTTERREQAGYQERRRGAGFDKPTAQDLRRGRQGTRHRSPVEFVLLRGMNEFFCHRVGL